VTCLFPPPPPPLNPLPPPPPVSVTQDCKSDENEMATDNALSALAALLEHHKDALDPNHVRRGVCSQWYIMSQLHTHLAACKSAEHNTGVESEHRVQRVVCVGQRPMLSCIHRHAPYSYRDNHDHFMIMPLIQVWLCLGCTWCVLCVCRWLICW